ncbi:S9 family peptidase [Neoactinobaculum massilliense]|uniref:S9 family peptidase n=1 Tax=Neoactinobaculum massilliense TaxID=2364794 RepID=UPI000F5450C9|nr:prolyl oligopeptidase family serine peptidase [Neoactinobaculum massilliense]
MKDESQPAGTRRSAAATQFTEAAPLTAPVAKRVPTERVFHGDTYIDNYEWLRDKNSPDVQQLLHAENAFTDQQTAHLAGVRAALAAEFAAHTKLTDVSVPVRRGAWWYVSRTRAGQQYPAVYRIPDRGVRPTVYPIPASDDAALDGTAGANLKVPDEASASSDAGTATGGAASAAQGRKSAGGAAERGGPAEQLVYDANALAEGEEFLLLSGFAPSPDGKLGALGVDFSGNEHFTLRIFDIESGEVIDDSVTNLGYGLAWTADSTGVFYTRVDDAWRTWQVWLHRIGSAEDELIFQENDEKFELWHAASRDGRWVVITSESSTSTEVMLVSTEDPAQRFVVTPRRAKLEYQVEPAGDQLLITHNAAHADFEVSTAPVAPSDPAEWVSIFVPAAGEHVDGVDAFRHFAVISMRSGGETQLRVMVRDQAESSGGSVRDNAGSPTINNVDKWQVPVAIDTPAGGATSLAPNETWDTAEITYVYTSLLTPRTYYSYAPAAAATTADGATSAGTSVLIKRTEVPDYDPSAYVQDAVWVTAQDGTKVPMTVVRRREVQPDGTNPGYIYGYGSYGVSNDPFFSPQRIALLDRGVVIGWTHVRGGGELGRAWYEGGKLLDKKHTFTDFVDSAHWLIDNGWVAPDRLAAEGRSAGGLLMGAVANLAPETFRAILAGVPFVDALTTILNPSLPLTAGEWEEWGNPIESEEVYRYMKSYSPTENIRPVEYPAILATTSLNDVRVFYVEPTKWVQLLRATVTNGSDRPILERIQMVAGHFGKTGRTDAWNQRAYELGWLLDQIGATERI